MKKILFFIMIFFLFPCMTQAKNVVALGDSITTGYGVEENESYVSLFCTELKVKSGENVQCNNLAVNGLTSNGLIDLLQVEETREKIKKSDYILLSIGGNDFLKELTSNLSTYLTQKESYPQVSVIGNRLTSNLSTILDEIIILNPQVKILLVPLYNPYKVVMTGNLTLLNAFNDVKKQYIEVVSKYDQVKIDPKLSSTLERDEYLNVSIEERNIDPHPNRLGHDAIAQTLMKEIEVLELPVEAKTFSIINYLYLGMIFILLFILWRFLKK